MKHDPDTWRYVLRDGIGCLILLVLGTLAFFGLIGLIEDATGILILG